MEKKNIEDLSNLVFGLALTLGALNLVQPKTDSFSALLIILLNFALSFLIILWFWWLYNVVIKETQMDRRVKYMLNFILLFLVAIEPYLLNISPTVAGATAYALDLAAALLIFVIFFQFLIDETPVDDVARRKRLRRSRNVSLICVLIFIGSVFVQLAPELQSNGVQGLIWLSVLVFVFLSQITKRE